MLNLHGNGGKTIAMNSERKFDVLLERVYQACVEPDGWEYFIDTYAEIFPHSKTGLAGIEHGSNRKKAYNFTNSYSPEALSEYNEYFAHKNPFALDKLGRNPSNIYWGSELLSKRKLFKTEFYQDFLRRHDNAWMGFGICVHEGPTEKVYLTNNTNEKHEREFKEQFRIMSRLLPHMHRASEFWFRFMQNRKLEDTFQNLINGFDVAIFILDDNCKLLQHNQEAEIFLHQESLITVDYKGNFIFKSSFNFDAFHRNFASRINDMRSKETGLYFNLEGKEHTLFNAFLHPLYFPHGEIDTRFHMGSARQFALFVSNPKRPIKADTRQIATSMGISPAEAALAKSLANGASLNDYADKRGVSKHTARAQLKSALRKTNSSRQAELVARIIRTFGFNR